MGTQEVINAILCQVGMTNDQLITEVFPEVASIHDFDNDELKDIIKGYKSCTVNNRNIIISKVKEIKLLGMIHWVKDAYCCDLDPVIEDFNNNKIQVANEHATIREQILLQINTVAKAAEPKKLKDEKDWYELLTKYLSLLQGSSRVLLDCVIREDKVPKKPRYWNLQPRG